MLEAVAISNKKHFWLAFAGTILVLVALTGFSFNANAKGKPDKPGRGQGNGRYSCLDSDNGQDATVKGTVNVNDSKNQTTVVTSDTCLDTNTVQEAYCAKAGAKVASTATLTCALGSVCQAGACVPVEGSLTQTVSPDSPTGIIADADTNVTLARFLWTANGEDIRISTLSVSGTIPNFKTLSNVRLKVDGIQIGATIFELVADGHASTNWGSFGNTFIINADTTVTVEIIADTTDFSIVPGDTITVALVAGNNNAAGTLSLVNISTLQQTGNTLTVGTGAVTVEKNNTFGDRSAANPTGVVNAQNKKVASLIITAGTGEDADLTQVVLKDAAPNVCIGTYLQNLTIKDSAGNQLAPTYSNPASSCATANSYTFNINPAKLITLGSPYVVDVYADLKAALTVPTSLITVDAVMANGRSTGANASHVVDVLLQKQYIALHGTLSVSADADTPVANNYLMGSTDQTIAKFQLTAGSAERMVITQLVISSNFSIGSTGTMQNLRLIDDATGTQIGNALPSFDDSVAGTSSPNGTYSHAAFSNLNLEVPGGFSKTVALKVDFTTFEDGGFDTTGQQVTPVVLADYNAAASGGNPVTAIGRDSGVSITTSVVENQPAGAWAQTATLYRARLTVAFASDTPSGAASPSAVQTIMKVVITNQANSGQYSATVAYFDLELLGSILQNPGVDTDRVLTVYKDSLSATALGSYSYPWATLQSSGFSASQFTDTNFTDTEITSGASKTFLVTLDTTDASSNENLSVRLAPGSIKWDDGKHWRNYITDMNNLLPLQFKTFVY